MTSRLPGLDTSGQRPHIPIAISHGASAARTERPLFLRERPCFSVRSANGQLLVIAQFELQQPPVNVDGAGNRCGALLIRLAHIDQQIGVVEGCLGLRQLCDLGVGNQIMSAFHGHFLAWKVPERVAMEATKRAA